MATHREKAAYALGMVHAVHALGNLGLSSAAAMVERETLDYIASHNFEPELLLTLRRQLDPEAFPAIETSYSPMDEDESLG